MRTLRNIIWFLAGIFLSCAAVAQTADDAQRGDTVSWSVEPQTVASSSSKLALTLHGAVLNGWHVYSLKQAPDGPTPLLVTLDANSVASAAGAVTETKPIKFRDPAFGLDTQFYEHVFTLTVPVHLKAGVATGQPDDSDQCAVPDLQRPHLPAAQNRTHACADQPAGGGLMALRNEWSRRLSAGLGLAAGLAAAGAIMMPVYAQIAVRNQGYIPFSDAPINYRSDDLSDPVALLEKRIEAGDVSLTYGKDNGYLNSVLDLLKVPVDSQTLVFSKTSFQYPKISPDHPRALYYNDDIYVGKVHDGNAIEIVSFDPKQGAIFYLLDERKVDKPVFQRAELDCTQCHIAAGTRGVPGVLLRSVFPTPTGTLTPRASSYITDQETPLKQRWGGWYVSGALRNVSMGNAAVSDPATAPASAANGAGSSPFTPKLTPLPDKSFDPSSYLAPGSDPVALLVLTHQAQMHNLITLTNYQTRLALYALAGNQQAKDPQANAPHPSVSEAPSLESLPDATRHKIQAPANQLLHFLLFANEAPLGGLNARQLIRGVGLRA